MKLYGKTTEEKLLEEKHASRQIVKEVLDYGINERQKYQIIKLLAENLESYTHMQLLTWMVDELQLTDVGDLTGLKERAMQQLASQHAELENTEDADGQTVQ